MSDDPAHESSKQKVDFAPENADPSTYKYFPDDPNSAMSLIQTQIKEPSQYFDPCEMSARMSRQCLEDHWDDPDKKSKCKQFFEAYKDCKAMWIAEKRK